ALFTGWYLDKAIMWREISNNGTLKVRFFRLYIFILKFIAPIAILCIFLNELHLFG
ncbi:MAG: sodium-dependent transporter, partial [Bacteroidaceae bacterium]|nr:sodium-dependent transporter [Bacteroidaceae bacterium]